MGRGILSFAFILVLTFGALFSLQPFASCKEFRRESTCYHELLHLDCGKLSFIALHEAYFTTGAAQENQTCHSPLPEHEYIEDAEVVTESANHSVCYEDLRIALNRRCSGFKSCNYSYSQQPERVCSNPQGVFIVRYDCVRESNVNRYCNSKVPAREGYIASPGFPQYYPKLSECSWTLSASDGQTIFVKILHLHLRDATDVTPTASDVDAFYALSIRGQLPSEQMVSCVDDRLTVMEGIVKRFSVCGEGLDSLKSVEIDAVKDLELRFRSMEFLPAAGFLVYFKVMGCPTLAAGEGSYLLERNGSFSVYACQDDHVFNDTLENTRSLQCIRDHHWNDTLPPCTPLGDLITTTTEISLNASLEHGTDNSTVESSFSIHEFLAPYIDKKAGIVEDIIIPCALIVILLLGNSIILIVICVIRKRHKADMDEEAEELNETQPPVKIEEQAAGSEEDKDV